MSNSSAFWQKNRQAKLYETIDSFGMKKNKKNKILTHVITWLTPGCRGKKPGRK